jgi:predicted HTH domain antitoxin
VLGFTMIVKDKLLIILKKMGLQISISDSIVQALRLPEQRIEQELRRELAIALYTQDILAFGKARELADMDKYEFGQLLARRKVVRHYSFEELNDDLTYARGE